jgi:RNA polymerase sigma-70 factor (ECF subfamily)
MEAGARPLPLDGRKVDDGWESAVEQVYARRARQLWDYARRLGLDAGRSEEVAQEAFTRLLCLESGDRPRDPDAWLFRVAHNLAVDAHRRSRRWQLRPVQDPADTPDLVERLAVWQAVERLPERQRAAVYLRFRADFDYATIARILDISESGARANVFRALARLREWMEDR